MNKLKRLLWPNRLDCLTLVVAILFGLGFAAAHLLVSGLGEIGDWVGVGFFTCIAAVWIAVGAVVALNRHSSGRVRVLLIASVIAVVGSYLFYRTAPLFPYFSNPGGQWGVGNSSIFEGDDWGRFTPWVYYLLAAPFVSWGLFSVARWFPFWISKLSGARTGIDRKKFLIGLAGVLLVIGVGNNILNEVMDGYDNALTTILIAIVSSLVSLFWFVVFVYFPVRLISGNSARWKKVLVVLFVLLSVFGPVVWQIYEGLVSPSEYFAYYGIALVGISILILSLTAARDPEKIALPLESESPESRDVAPVVVAAPNRRPSLWTGLLVVGLLAWIAFPFFFIVSLVPSQGFSVANNAAKIKWFSRGQINSMSVWNSHVWQCQFDDTTDPNVFALLDGNGSSNLMIKRSARQIDFSKLSKKPMPLSVSIDQGEITSRQLNDLLSQPVAMLSLYGCDVLGPSRSVEPVSVDAMCFQSPMGSALDRFVNDFKTRVRKTLLAFKTFENVEAVIFNTRVFPEFWDEVVRASETTNVLMHYPPEGLAIKQIQLAKQNIVFRAAPTIGSDGLIDERFRLWLAESNATFYFYNSNNDWRVSSDRFFAMLFAFPDRFKAMMYKEIDWRLVRLNTRLEEDCFVFQTGKNRAVTGLCIPFGEDYPKIAEFSELKVLSLDETWLQPRAEGNVPRKLGDLSGLVNLEALYLSASAQVDSMDFLTRTTKLKHLQIPTVDRTQQAPTGFHDCPSLETITMLGLPDQKSVTEFRRLPKLRKLTIVDLYDEVYSEKAMRDSKLANLKEKLPNTEVILIDEDGFKPDLPTAFVEHRERVAKRLSAKLLGKDVSKRE